MTLLFSRDISGPCTHALVIGVGAYPDAKPDRGVLDDLRNVSDLPSAADSAKLVCDWLLANRDKLAAPLATLEVLISDVPDGGDRYAWAHGPVEAATEANVLTRGSSWFKRVSKRKGDVAFFYCCGHGARRKNEPVLFLEDLNRSQQTPWSYIHLTNLAYTLRRSPEIASGFLFVDTCGEIVFELDLAVASDCRWLPYQRPGLPMPSKVSLLCAAVGGRLAYDGEESRESKIRFGRFTQTVLHGLSGSSARPSGKRWQVGPHELLKDLKNIRRMFFDHWSEEQPFEPDQNSIQTDPVAIVFPTEFEVPLLVTVEPSERMSEFALSISHTSNPDDPHVKGRPAGEGAWSTTVPPRRIYYTIATKGEESHDYLFELNGPRLDLVVTVS